jgi:hypothetical protein
VGSTTTLPPGSDAQVLNSGSDTAAIFDFEIPQGEPGADGAPGADGVGVPTGGTTGQVLAKASGSDYDTEWAAKIEGFTVLAPASGYRFVPGVQRLGWAEPGFTYANGNTYYFPFILRETVAFDAFCPWVHTAQASSSVRMAICKAGSNWQPTELVIESGDIATTSTGEKVTTVTKTVLTPGRYFAATRSDAAVALRVATIIYPDISQGNLNNDQFFAQFLSVSVAEAYGAFSATPTAWTTINFALSAGASVARFPVALRSAAP